MVNALAPLFEEKGRQQETIGLKRGVYYPSSTSKEEKVHVCLLRRKAFPLSGRRYRMISPFLFSERCFQKAILFPFSRYAGRRENGACFRL
jgi:hypothetical protein